MKHTLLLFFVLMLSISVKASDTLRTARPNEPYNAVKLGMTTASILIPEIQFNYEHRWKKYSWQAGVGTIIPKRYNIDDTMPGTAYGYSLRLDVRKHNKNPAYSGVFLGVSMFYRWFKYPHAGKFVEEHYQAGEYDEYLLIKSTLGWVVQFGGHHYIGKKIDVEMYIGLGPKVMYTRHEGRTHPELFIFARHPNVAEIESRTGTNWALALQGQISVGYILGK